MLLHYKQTDALVEIHDIEALINPVQTEVPGQIQSGQEEQELEQFDKENLIFPSGEPLPQCWLDANYKLKQPAG
jgi:hypothetical protein